MAPTDVETGRVAQKQRTRNALVLAAGEFLARGVVPSIEEVAEAAGVSRATAYRYFPSIDALFAEARIVGHAPGPDESLAEVEDLHERVRISVQNVNRRFLDNETATHAMARSLADQWLTLAPEERPGRPRKRLDWIDAALQPARDRLSPASLEFLANALGVVMGMEAVLSATDVVGLSADDAEAVLLRIADLLVDAAVAEG